MSDASSEVLEGPSHAATLQDVESIPTSMTISPMMLSNEPMSPKTETDKTESFKSSNRSSPNSRRSSIREKISHALPRMRNEDSNGSAGGLNAFQRKMNSLGDSKEPAGGRNAFQKMNEASKESSGGGNAFQKKMNADSNGSTGGKNAFQNETSKPRRNPEQNAFSRPPRDGSPRKHRKFVRENYFAYKCEEGINDLEEGYVPIHKRNGSDDENKNSNENGGEDDERKKGRRDLLRMVNTFGDDAPKNAFGGVVNAGREEENNQEKGEGRPGKKNAFGGGGGRFIDVADSGVERSKVGREENNQDKGEGRSVKKNAFGGVGGRSTIVTDSGVGHFTEENNQEKGEDRFGKKNAFGGGGGRSTIVTDSGSGTQPSEKSNGFGGRGRNDDKTSDTTEDHTVRSKPTVSNRLYSGHVCDKLEDETNLREMIINEPGTYIENIEDLQFKITQQSDGKGTQLEKHVYYRETFDCFGLDRKLLKNIGQYGYINPLLVQKVAMYPIIQGQDILINAQTGCGKTATFLIPVINHIVTNPRERKKGDEWRPGVDPRVVILTPTRELAIQIAKEAVKFTKGYGYDEIKIANTYGGTKRTLQRTMCFDADIIVGTVGRTIDLLFPPAGGYTKATVENVEYVIIDEADRMLDDGFRDQVTEIVQSMPEKVRKVMTSATFPLEIQDFSKAIMNDTYMFAAIGIRNSPSQCVKQTAYKVERGPQKYKLLEKILIENNIGDKSSPGKAMIFTNTKRQTDFLGCKISDDLRASCITMHGDRSQEQREYALWQFSTSKCPVLVATNVAARGLDIPKVDLIINFECPRHENFRDDYIHRIGRSGRVGQTGTSVTLIDPEKDSSVIPVLYELMKLGNAEIPLWLKEAKEEQGGQSEESSTEASIREEEAKRFNQSRRNSDCSETSRPTRPPNAFGRGRSCTGPPRGGGISCNSRGEPPNIQAGRPKKINAFNRG